MIATKTRQRDESSEKDWHITVARSLAEIEGIRQAWESLQCRQHQCEINADIERFISVIKAHAGESQPCVVLFEKKGQPTALVVARIMALPINLKVGYATLAKPQVRCMSVAYGGILGSLDPGMDKTILEHLMSMTTAGAADMVHFNHLNMASPFFRLCRKTPGILCRGYFPKTETHWLMSVPENLEAFYQARSKKHRGNLRRCFRKLEEAYPDQTKVVTYTKEAELDDAIAAASRISQATYQQGLGCGFVDNEWTRTLLSTAARKGWLRMAVLYVENEPGAFQVGLHYGNKYMLDQIGFDPRWRPFNLGTVLFLRVLADTCSDPDIEYVDFGFGDAEYKTSYGDRQWQEASVSLFAPRLRPVLLNAVRTATVGLNAATVSVANKLRVTPWIKRRWRNLLQQERPEAQDPAKR